MTRAAWADDLKRLNAATSHLEPPFAAIDLAAMAGELCERFNELHLIDGDLVTGSVPIYRGEGKAFL